MSLNQPVSPRESQPAVQLSGSSTVASDTDNVVDFAAWRVRLRGSAAQGPQPIECRVQKVNASGLVVDTAAQLGRFTWLDVDLPDGTGVRALGEVIPRRDPVALAVEVRFKHLFPDHRARLLSALALQG